MEIDRTHQSASAHIESLDEKCLLKILACLPIVDLTRCSMVCKKWHALAGQLLEMGELTVYHSKPVKRQASGVLVRSNAAFAKLITCPQFKLLKKLNLHINSQLLDEPLIDLSNYLQLEQLQVDHPTANQAMLELLIEKGVRLSSLRLYNCYKIVDLTKVYKVFPHLTHIKTAFVERSDTECLELPADTLYPLKYFEQYHHSCVDRSLINILLIACPKIEYLSLSLGNALKIPQLVQNLAGLRELNLNIPNDKLKFCWKYKPTIFKAIAKRDVVFRINGLPVKRTNTRTTRFRVDPDELYLITYEQLSLANQLNDYSMDELKFYFNNFKEIEITEKAPSIIRPLVNHDLVLKRLRKMTYHYKNRNSAKYFFEMFFQRLPNLVHLFIAEVENLSEEQFNKLPVLFPQLTNLEMHAYQPIAFPIEFIRGFQYLQILVIKSDNGFLRERLHEVVKDLQYLTNFEIDPVYDEIIEFVERKSDHYKDLRCHLHQFSCELKEQPIQMNGVCRDRHPWWDDQIFEEFDQHNYEFESV